MDKHDNNELSLDLMGLISGGVNFTEEDRANALSVFRKLKADGESWEGICNPLLERLREMGRNEEADETEAFIREMWDLA